MPGFQVVTMPVSQDKFQRKEKYSQKLAAKLIEKYQPYVLFSGGRDSLVTLHLVKRVSEAKKTKVLAVFVDTTNSTPGNKGYVVKICKKLKVKLKIVRPKEDFFSLVRKWGFPTVTRRWCCYHLKIEPLRRFFRKIDAPKIVFDGMRAEESPKRKTYPIIGWHKHFKSFNCHPIFYWSKDDVTKYIELKGLEENSLYRIFPRATDCWCTAFKTVSQFKALKEHFPEFFQEFVELEKSLKTEGSALFRSGKKVYLKDM